MTQPAVSKTIADLERILDAALFDRSRRALVLTGSGELFMRYAQAGLATLQQGLDTLESAGKGANMVALGALPTVAAGVIPRALEGFSRHSLACRTLVESGPSPYLLNLLRTAAIDFVIGRLASPNAMQGLSFEHLYSEDLALVVRPAHPLLARDGVTLQDVAEHQLLMPPPGAIIRPAVDALLIAGGVGRLHAPIETVSNSLGRSYTLFTDAVWVISESVVITDIATGQLVKLPLDMQATTGPIGITTRSGMDLSPPARALLDCVRDAVGP